MLQLSQNRDIVLAPFLPSRVLVEPLDPPCSELLCKKEKRPHRQAQQEEDVSHLEDALGEAFGANLQATTHQPREPGQETPSDGEDSDLETHPLLQAALRAAVESEGRQDVGPLSHDVRDNLANAEDGGIDIDDDDEDSDVSNIWELPPPAEDPLHDSAPVRAAAAPDPLPRPARTLDMSGPRRDRRQVPKLCIGHWETHELCINLSQTYGCSWFDMRGICKRHPNCTLSRSCRSARPIGLIVAWLQFGLTDGCHTKAIHRSFNPSHQQRIAAREWFRSLPDSAPWFAAEPPRGSGPDEPDLD